MIDLTWRLHNELWLRGVFRWLVRNGMGVADGSRPVGWVQQHNIAAYNRIEELCKANSVGMDRIAVRSGELYAGKTRLASCAEIFDHADAQGR